MHQNARDQVFDQKFVFTATAIGVAYTLIVLAVNRIVGPSAAGVAGVALTALATGLFQRFESLRFHSVPDDQVTTLSFRKFNLGYFACVLSAFFGIQAFLGSLHRTTNQVLGLGDSSSLNQEKLAQWLLQPKVLIPMITLTALAHFMGGWIVGKTAGMSAYIYSGAASFGSNLLGLLLGLPVMIKYPRDTFKIIQPNLVYGVFWLIYLGTALLGARAGLPKRTLGE